MAKSKAKVTKFFLTKQASPGTATRISKRKRAVPPRTATGNPKKSTRDASRVTLKLLVTRTVASNQQPPQNLLTVSERLKPKDARPMIEKLAGPFLPTDTKVHKNCRVSPGEDELYITAHIMSKYFASDISVEKLKSWICYGGNGKRMFFNDKFQSFLDEKEGRVWPPPATPGAFESVARRLRQLTASAAPTVTAETDSWMNIDDLEGIWDLESPEDLEILEETLSQVQL